MRACKTQHIVGHSDVKGLSNSRSVKRFGGERANGRASRCRVVLACGCLQERPANTCSRAAPNAKLGCLTVWHVAFHWLCHRHRHRHRQHQGRCVSACCPRVDTVDTRRVTAFPRVRTRTVRHLTSPE